MNNKLFRSSILLSSIFVLISNLVFAAPSMNNSSLGFRDWMRGGTAPSIGLIDASKLSISHDISFGVSSGGGQSLAQSVYMTKFGYQLSNPVTLTFLLGVQNSQYGGNTIYSGSNNSVIGGMSLQYRPRENVLFRVDLLHSPNNMFNTGINNRFWAVPEPSK